MTILIQQIKDSIQSSSERIMVESQLTNTNEINWWSIIAVAEFVLIVILFLKLQMAQRKRLITADRFNELKKAKSKDIDMNNLMNSINLSRVLYKQLSRKCHPDRFQDNLMKQKADKIFQEISRYKRNYEKLTELKQIAEKELKINF